MKEELRNLIIKLQVSNMRTKRLRDSINTAKDLLKQYENCLNEELKISNVLANKLELELLIDDAITAQTE